MACAHASDSSRTAGVPTVRHVEIGFVRGPPGVRVTALDAMFLLAAVVAAFAGYRRGLLVGVLSLAGLVLGIVPGSALAPGLVRDVAGPIERLAVVVAVVVAAAVLVKVLGSTVGGRLRALLPEPGRHADSAAGAAFGGLTMLVVLWAAGSAVASSSVPVLSGPVARSEVLRFVDGVLPREADAVYSSLRRALRDGPLPQVFAPFVDERIVPVPAPDVAEVTTDAVRAAGASIVRVRGAAGACDKSVSGTGFVYAPERVMTNAHVVAAVSAPTVQVGGRGWPMEATVVLFDPARDVAVLHVPGLEAPALAFDPEVAPRDSMAVAGFPEGGPYHVGAARIRTELSARGRDIFDDRSVTREVYSLYALVRHGNSGGPLLTPEGTVAGVVFATSATDSRTGYALTAEEVASDAAAGARSTERVSTGSRCA
jgi:S1-C subfamily serine protease